MDSPEVFDSPFFSLDNSMPAQTAYSPNQQQGATHSQLQVPRQAFMPFTEQAYSQGYGHAQSRPQGSYPSSPSWQAHSRQHQHAMPQYGNHYTFGGARHHPFASTQSLHAKTTSETKSRLDKKHVEVLEQEFQKNQKPSSTLKRELAERMGHELARINNWFQNRRAKEKSNRRTAEYAAKEANHQRDSSEGASSGPRSPDLRDEAQRPPLDNMQRPILSSATIGQVGPEDESRSSEPQPLEAADSDESLQASSRQVDADTQSNPQPENNNHGPTVVLSRDEPDDAEAEAEAQQPFQTPDSDLSHEFDYRSLQDFSGLPQCSTANMGYLDEGEVPTAWFHPLPQAPSDYFGSDATPLALLNAGAPLAMAEPFPSENALKVQQLASPVSMSSTSQTPPPPKEMSSRFALKSPRPMNIAARRNHQRPAPLGLAITRKGPYCQGPKTGIDMPSRRPNDLTHMRRTASATGLRLPRVSEGGLRSPGIHFQAMRSPSYNSSTSPISRSDTPATQHSDDHHHHHHGLPYSNFNAPLTSRAAFESSINTPPVTPGLPMNHYHGFANPFEQAWAHAAGVEQPLATPSLCSHGGSEMDFPNNNNNGAGATSHHGLPSYIATSQPATPGFPRPDAFGPNFRYGAGGMSNSASEYTFPDSSSGYVDSSSPVMLHHEQHHSGVHHQSAKTFQFAQNVTPQDFSSEN